MSDQACANYRSQPLGRVAQRHLASRIQARLVRAEQLAEEGDVDGTAKKLIDILRLAPRHPIALHRLAQLRYEQGEIEAAAALLHKLVLIRPRDASLRNDLGNLYLSMGSCSAAIKEYQLALEHGDETLDTVLNMSVALVTAGRQAEAIRTLKRVIEFAFQDASALITAGNLLLQLHRVDEAEQQFTNALQLDSNSADARVGLAIVAMTRGKKERARYWLRGSIERDPNNSLAWYQLSRSRKQTPELHNEMQLAQRALRHSQRAASKVNLHFALANMHDDLGEAALAFNHLRQANQLVQPPAPFDPVAFEELVTQIKEVFTKKYFLERSDGDQSISKPVFIAGAPRSGTTLVEQILASHPDCAGLGEHPFFDRKVAEQTADLCTIARRLNSDMKRQLAEQYLADIDTYYPNAQRVSNKAPGLMLQLGLIALLFPRAPLLLCQRNWLDVGLSIYFQHFAYGNLPCAYDLRHIGIYLRGIRSLLHHWERVLADRVHLIRYEQLIARQQETSRSLLAHCQLRWDPACLNFHTTPRDVHTASAWQVREPVYQSAIGRSEAYRQYLDDLRDELDDWSEENDTTMASSYNATFTQRSS